MTSDPPEGRRRALYITSTMIGRRPDYLSMAQTNLDVAANLIIRGTLYVVMASVFICGLTFASTHDPEVGNDVPAPIPNGLGGSRRASVKRPSAADQRDKFGGMFANIGWHSSRKLMSFGDSEDDPRSLVSSIPGPMDDQRKLTSFIRGPMKDHKVGRFLKIDEREKLASTAQQSFLESDYSKGHSSRKLMSLRSPVDGHHNLMSFLRSPTDVRKVDRFLETDYTEKLAVTAADDQQLFREFHQSKGRPSRRTLSFGSPVEDHRNLIPFIRPVGDGYVDRFLETDYEKAADDQRPFRESNYSQGQAAPFIRHRAPREEHAVVNGTMKLTDEDSGYLQGNIFEMSEDGDGLGFNATNLTGNGSDYYDWSGFECANYVSVQDPEKHYTVLVLSALGIICILLTMVVLTRKSMRTSCNCYLTALAVSDLIFLSMLSCLFVKNLVSTCEFHITSEWTAISKFMRTLMNIFLHLTIGVTVMLGFERYIAICRPMRAMTMCTVKRARIIVACLLFVSVVLESPKFFDLTYEYVLLPNNETKLAVTHAFLYDDQLYCYIVTCALVTLLPLLLLTVLTARIIYEIRKSARYLQVYLSADLHVRSVVSSEEIRITVMLTLVIVVFFICHVPYMVYSLLMALGDFSNIASTSSLAWRQARSAAQCLVAIKALCNLLLYCWMSDKFWATFKRTFFKVCQCPRGAAMLTTRRRQQQTSSSQQTEYHSQHSHHRVAKSHQTTTTTALMPGGGGGGGYHRRLRGYNSKETRNTNASTKEAAC